MDESLRALLEELASERAADAWRGFVRRYGTILCRVVNRFERSADRRNECFLFVCNGLSDQDFRRLRAFKLDGTAKFETWLMTVATNLCIDWQRKEDGRYRPPTVVERMSPLEQKAFHLLFVRQLRRSECLERLRPQFPDLTEQQLSDLNATLFRRLSARQRFVLSSRQSEPGDPDFEGLQGELHGLTPRHATHDGPEALSVQAQDVERLEAALARLPADDRLLLALRYEQGLTLGEVAQICGLGDPFRAKRRIAAALYRLRTEMEAATGRTESPQEAPHRP